MDRRNFLKRVGMCAAAVAAAPAVLESLAAAPQVAEPFTVDVASIPVATISQYQDYVSFSEFARDEIFGPEVIKAAEELSAAHNARIDSLMRLSTHYYDEDDLAKLFPDLSPLISGNHRRHHPA